MNIAWPIYQRLAEAFPHEFKLAFGDEMMQAGEDAIADVASAAEPSDSSDSSPTCSFGSLSNI